MGSWWVPNDWHERRSASGRWTARSESQRSSRRAEVPVAADLRSGQEPCPTGKATPTPLRRPRPATRSRGRREIQRVQPHANERQGSRGKSAPRADPRPVRTRHGRRPEGPAARMPFATVANPARRHHRCCQGRAATARRWTARPRTTPSITEQPSRESSRHCSLRRDPAVRDRARPVALPPSGSGRSACQGRSRRHIRKRRNRRSRSAEDRAWRYRWGTQAAAHWAARCASASPARCGSVARGRRRDCLGR